MPNLLINHLVGIQPSEVKRYTNNGDEQPSMWQHEKVKSYRCWSDTDKNRSGPEYSPTVKEFYVNNRTLRLSARYCPVMMDDGSISAESLEVELLAAMAQEIICEIDQNVFRTLRSLPPTPTAANTFDPSKVQGQSTCVSNEFNALAILINRQAIGICARTRMSAGNWALVSPTALTMLEAATSGAFHRTTCPKHKGHVGILNNMINVYVDQYACDDTPVLVGYKQSDENVGSVYYPDVPIITNGYVVDPMTFESVVQFMTRSGFRTFSDDTMGSYDMQLDHYCHGLVGIEAQTFGGFL
jgi:hypothetical protein